VKISQVTERFSKLIFISMLYKEHVTGFHFVSVRYVSLHCVL